MRRGILQKTHCKCPAFVARRLEGEGGATPVLPERGCGMVRDYFTTIILRLLTAVALFRTSL